MALLDYQPDTGQFFWKARPPMMFRASGRYSPDRRAASWNSKYAGREAFTASQPNSGGRQAVIDNSHFGAHRVAWKIAYGDEPEKIAAVNGDLSDCRLNNLSALPHRRTEAPPPSAVMKRVEARCRQLENGCLEWTGPVNNKGYGIGYDGLKREYTHRIMYKCRHGSIPSGLELDHLCRNTRCCNPDHLEPVTHKENVRRGDAGLHLPSVARARARQRRSHSG
jgi:hypothetical protein